LILLRDSAATRTTALFLIKRVLCGTLTIVVLVSGCASASGVKAPPSSGGQDAANCAVREISRHRLTVLGNRPLYVEADAFVANGRGEVLLAGTPNYLWQVSPPGEITGLTEDSIFGAVIAPDGTARIVPAPITARQIHGIRVTSRNDDGWDVVFAEVAAFVGDRQPDEALRLWYGVYDGEGWNSLEQIPAPDGIPLSTLFTSSLVRRGDSLAWALVPAMGFLRRDIVLVQRREGRWAYESVPTRTPADVDLSYSDSLGLLLAVVQPDPGLRGDGNSLMLWAQRPEWQVVRRLVHGDVDGRVYEPSLRRLSTGLLANWTTPAGTGREARNELRALVGRLEEQTAPAVVLDANVSIWSQAPPLLPAPAMPVWAAHHVLPDSDASEIRFLTLSADSAIELGRVASPYYLRVSSVASAASELLVSGMEYAENRFAFSLLLRARVECSERP
jgi:hypothetical protein